MPSLRQLRALDLIGQTGSFTRTAERLFVTQSAISILIRDLEDEIGLPLVERGRVARLTDAGWHLQRAGHRAHQEITRALDEVKDGSHAMRTIVRVGAGSLSAATFVPAALRKLQQDGAGFRVELIDRPVNMLSDLLASGQADAVIGSADSPLRSSAELEAEVLRSDTLCIACAHDHPLASRLPPEGSGVRWRALEDQELVLVGRNGGQWRSLLLEQLAQTARMRVGHEVQLYSTAIEIVRQGLGVAVLPRFAGSYLDRSAFAVRRLISPGTRWSVYWIARKRSLADRGSLLQLKQALAQVLEERSSGRSQRA